MTNFYKQTELHYYVVNSLKPLRVIKAFWRYAEIQKIVKNKYSNICYCEFIKIKQ